MPLPGTRVSASSTDLPSPSSQEVILSKEQRSAVEQVVRNAGKKSLQVVSGYAGTGKTTIIKHVIHHLPQHAVCAYTGKAGQRPPHQGSSPGVHHPQLDLHGGLGGRVGEEAI